MNLKELREKKNLTQEQLEALSGVDKSTISVLETRPGRRPSFETAVRLAKALNVRPEDLFPVADGSAA